MGADYDPPTRRLPAQPVAPVAAPGYEPPEHEIARRLRSLQSVLAFVGLLAALALGVALYTLLTDEDREDGDGRRGASTTQVERLESRIDELEDDVDDRATKNSVSELRDDQQQLGEQVEQAAGGGEQGDEVNAAIEDLQGDVQQLQQRLDDLAEQQAAGGDTGGAQTP